METHGGFDINTGRDMHREKIQKLNITKKQNTWIMQWLFRVHYHEDDWDCWDQTIELLRIFIWVLSWWSHKFTESARVIYKRHAYKHVIALINITWPSYNVQQIPCQRSGQGAHWWPRTSLMRLMKRPPKRQGLWRLHCRELTVICCDCCTATATTCTASYISAASVCT